MPSEAEAAKACVNPEGQVKIRKRKCKAKKGEVLLDLATISATVQGDAGPQGPQGAKGDTGPAGPVGADAPERAWGEGAGGELVLSESGLINPLIQYTDIIIEPGVNASLRSGSIIRCTGTFVNNGTLSITPSGYGGARSSTATNGYERKARRGIAESSATSGAVVDTSVLDIRATGGLAGTGFSVSGISASRLLDVPLVGGGGGGAGDTSFGTDGGGSAGIFCQQEIINNGIMNALGSNAANGDGGGGGGVWVLASQGTITNNGLISVKGGNGGASNSSSARGGGGSGGVVFAIAPSVNISLASVNVAGGNAGTNNGNITDSVRRGGGGGGGSYSTGGPGASVNTNGTQTNASNGFSGDLIVEDGIDPTPLLR